MTGLMNQTEDKASWVSLVYKYGVPAALAVYLVWNMSTSQASAIAAMSKTIETHSAISVLTSDDLKASSIRQEVYLRLLCINTAKTSDAQRSCLTVR